MPSPARRVATDGTVSNAVAGLGVAEFWDATWAPLWCLNARPQYA